MTPADFNLNEPEHLKQIRERTLLRIQELMGSDRLSLFSFATSSLTGVPIQAVILNAQGETLFESVIRTGLELDPESQKYHGLTRAEVDAAPTLEEVLPHLRKYLGDWNHVITFTPDFMTKALVRGCREEKLDMPAVGHWISGQDLLAPLVGTYNWTTDRWSKPKLIDCIGELALPGDFAALNTAKGNTQRLHFVLNHFAQGLQLPAVEHCERCGEPLDTCICGMDLPAGEPF